MLGTLEGKQFVVKIEQLNIIKNHIFTNFYSYQLNDMMIARLQDALDNQQAISGADASFYFHELREAELMQNGYTYIQAHQQALEDYQVSPFSLYHPNVIMACPDEFNNNWKRAWGILK